MWRTQWHRVNTTPACCALERISQPEASWFFLIQKVPDVSSVAEDPEISALLVEIIAQGPWKGEKRLFELCGSLWALPKPPAGHSLSCFNTLNLIVHLLKQSWPKLPRPSWVCASPVKSQITLPKIQHSRKCTRFLLSQHSKNRLVHFLGWEQRVKPGTKRDSLHFFSKIILLCFVTTLNHSDLHFTQNVYNTCAKFSNIYFSNLITFTQKLLWDIPFCNSKNPSTLHMHKAPQWHCWLVLKHTEPLHCWGES